MHHLRSLAGVFAKVPIWFAPCVIVIVCGFHSENALTGPADQLRQDAQ
jgi:hypothetical protein